MFQPLNQPNLPIGKLEVNQKIDARKKCEFFWNKMVSILALFAYGAGFLFTGFYGIATIIDIAQTVTGYDAINKELLHRGWWCPLAMVILSYHCTRHLNTLRTKV